MRQILFSLLLLTLTQNAFAMEDDPRMGKVQTLKVHYSTFDTRSLDVQQKVLIYTLNYQQKLRREFKDLIYSTLERAPSKKEKLTPKTCLEFSDKIIPIDEISTNEMKSLMGHSINRILSYIFQMRVFSTARGKYPETRYNEALKDQRHLLLETIDKARTEAHNYNISLQYNLFHILENSLKKDTVSFQFPHNKEMQNNKIKNSFKKFYAQESEIECIEDNTSIKQNELCNDKCFLQLFEAFSDEELYNEYKKNLVRAETYFIISQTSQSVYLNNIMSFTPPKAQEAPKIVYLEGKPKLSPNQTARAGIRERYAQKKLQQPAETKETSQQLPVVAKINSNSPRRQKKQKTQTQKPQPQKPNRGKGQQRTGKPKLPSPEVSESESSEDVTLSTQPQEEALQTVVLEQTVTPEPEHKAIQPSVKPQPIVTPFLQPGRSYLAALGYTPPSKPVEVHSSNIEKKPTPELIQKPAQESNPPQIKQVPNNDKNKLEIEKSAEEKKPVLKNNTSTPVSQPLRAGLTFSAALLNKAPSEPVPMPTSNTEVKKAEVLPEPSIAPLKPIQNQAPQHTNGKKKKNGIYIKIEPPVEKKETKTVIESPLSTTPPSGTFIVQGHHKVTKIVLQNGSQHVYNGTTEAEQYRVKLHNLEPKDLAAGEQSLSPSPQEKFYFAKINASGTFTVTDHPTLKEIALEEEK